MPLYLNYYAEALRAAAVLIEQSPGVTYVTYVTVSANGNIILACSTDEQVVALAHLVGDGQTRLAEYEGKQWTSLDAGTFRGFTVTASGPHTAVEVDAA